MSSTKVVKEVFGKRAKDLDITMINVNANPQYGNDADGTRVPKCKDLIDHATGLYPSLCKAYKDRMSKKRSSKNAADEVFSSVWFSPSSCQKLPGHPLPFGGDHRTESMFNKIGVYSTTQMFAAYTDSCVHAVLASKNWFDSKARTSDLLSTTAGLSEKDTEYATSRGAVNVVGDQTPESIRYMAKYERNDGRTGVSLICGSSEFLSGYVSIAPAIEACVGNLREYIKNDQYKGINLKSISAGSTSEEPDAASSIALSRLLAGSIITHDHLTVLKNVFGVNEIIDFDGDGETLKKISIDGVIEDYAKVKKYYAMASALNAIK